MLNQEIHWIQGVVPVADAFAGTTATDIFEVAGAEAVFLVIKGAGATGTDTITVLASSTITATATSAIPFRYRVQTTSDTWGDWTLATTTGFATTAGANQVYEVRAAAADMGASGYKYIKMVLTQLVDHPVTGCVLCGVAGLRHAEQPESLID